MWILIHVGINVIQISKGSLSSSIRIARIGHRYVEFNSFMGTEPVCIRGGDSWHALRNRMHRFGIYIELCLYLLSKMLYFLFQSRLFLDMWELLTSVPSVLAVDLGTVQRGQTTHMRFGVTRTRTDLFIISLAVIRRVQVISLSSTNFLVQTILVAWC